MKKNILAVCDTEQEFTCHLTDYLGQLAGSDSFPFEVQVFTNPRALEEFCGKNRAAFLLLTQEVYREALDWEDDSWKMARLLILEEEGEAPPGLERVNKYQSMDNIVRKIMEIAADAGILPPAAVGERKRKRSFHRNLYAGKPVSSNHIFFHIGPASGPQTPRYFI